jgi:RNase P protein component
MKKINIIKKDYEFTRIINLEAPYKGKSYTIFLEKKKTLNNYFFGISVPKKKV